ncbi:MAG: hypothetical protein IJ638_02630, partial [Alphaproteobacteria bacterium]|nr:hypothetical protein [Alphaproteobacteria bacterium]
PANTYSAGGTATSCTDCPANSTAPVGSEKIDDCTCNAGYYRSGNSCPACPKGQYQDQTGQSSCKACSSTTADWYGYSKSIVDYSFWYSCYGKVDTSVCKGDCDKYKDYSCSIAQNGSHVKLTVANPECGAVFREKKSYCSGTGSTSATAASLYTVEVEGKDYGDCATGQKCSNFKCTNMCTAAGTYYNSTQKKCASCHVELVGKWTFTGAGETDKSQSCPYTCNGTKYTVNGKPACCTGPITVCTCAENSSYAVICKTQTVKCGGSFNAKYYTTGSCPSKKPSYNQVTNRTWLRYTNYGAIIAVGLK